MISLRRGPLYITIAGLLFTGMVSLVKIARVEMSALEVVFWRGFIAVPLAFAIARPAGLRLRRRGLFLVRVVIGFSSMVGSFTAAKGLAVADLTLVTELRPMVIAIAAPLALGVGERAGGLVWLLLVAGLAGCALILAPDLAIGSTYGLWAVGATLLAAAAHISVRALTRTDDPRVMVFYFMIGVMVLSAGALLVTGQGLPAIPPLGMWPCLLGIGIFATGGQLFMTWAYAADRAPVVAAASYSTPIWAVLADLVVFGATPAWQTVLGGTLIVGAGLYLLLGRNALPPTSPPSDPDRRQLSVRSDGIDDSLPRLSEPPL